jgi:cytochrome c oxidase assembly protein Cox11
MYLYGIAGIIESHRSLNSCPCDVMMVTMIGCKYCMVGCASCICDLHGIAGIIESHRSFYSCPCDVMMVTI